MKRTLKKILGFALTATLVVGMAGCSSNTTATTAATTVAASVTDAATTAAAETTEKKEITIGCSWFNLTTEYQAKLRDDTIAAFEEKYPDVKIVEMDGKSDANTQNTQVDTLISQGVDAIIMVPFDAQQQIPAVQACKDAGIPCIQVCLETQDEGLKTSFIGSNDKTSGVLEMQELADQAGGKGGVVILEGPSGQNSQIQRLAGALEVIAKYPDMKVVANKFCNWDRAQAMSAIENMIQSGMDFSVIFSENDEMALGALAALKGTAYEDKVIVGGIDGIADALAAVKDGSLACTVLQQAYEQAQKVSDVAFMAANGEKVESYYEIPYVLGTSENIDDPIFSK